MKIIKYKAIPINENNFHILIMPLKNIEIKIGDVSKEIKENQQVLNQWLVNRIELLKKVL